MADLTHFTLTVPDEPPVGSVVIDTSGRAWQRNGAAWYPATFVDRGMAWPELMAAHRDVALVHDGAEGP